MQDLKHCCCCLNVYFILIGVTYNKMMIYIIVQYDTLKKIFQIKFIYQNMNIIYESNVNMIIAIDQQFINQSKKYYLDISKYNSKNHQEIQKQN